MKTEEQIKAKRKELEEKLVVSNNMEAVAYQIVILNWVLQNV